MQYLPPVPGAPADARWSPRLFLDSPLRLGFGAGALMLGLTALWWCRVLLGPAGPQALPSSAAHALFMTWGFLPLFMAGFLFTAVPRWLGVPPVAASSLFVPVGAQLAGWLIFGLALLDSGAGTPLLAGMGLAAVAAGWSSLAWRFARLLAGSRMRERTHARVLLAACAAGALLLDATVAAVMAQAWTLVQALALAALWGCIGVSYVAALHRMIPFYGAASEWLEARWPHWLLWTLVGVMALQALQALLEPLRLLGLPAAPALRGALRLGQGTLGFTVLALAWRWSRVQNLRQRLVAMLQRGLVWLGLALLLSALDQDAAALHAYAVGFLGTTLLAMATRVACGNTGRTVVADDFLWLLHRLLQAAVLLRLAAALWPATAYWNGPLAALVWAAVALGWLLRYGRWLGRPAQLRAPR